LDLFEAFVETLSAVSAIAAVTLNFSGYLSISSQTLTRRTNCVYDILSPHDLCL